MVRWLGARRVIEFVEKLIRIARETDPRPLYSYASYPPTEYLLPHERRFLSRSTSTSSGSAISRSTSRACKTSRRTSR